MNRRWSVLAGTSMACALAAAGLQLVPGAAQASPRSSAPAFHRVTSAPVVAAPAAPAARTLARVAQGPTAGDAVRTRMAKTNRDQALSVWSGIAGTVPSPQPNLSLAVGSKQVLQVSPSGALVTTKATGRLVDATGNLRQLFGITGVTLSEPTAVYDPVGKRFVLVAVTTSTTTSDVGIVVRVSKGATVSTKGSAWRTPYAYLTDDTGTESGPRVGVSADKVVIALADSDTSDATIAHLTLVIPKQKLYAAGGTGPDAWAGTSNSTYDGQTPVVNASKQKTAFVAVPATNDFTLISYTGPATTNPPTYVKSVTYSTTPLVDAPDVPVAGGDTLTLPPAVFTASTSWRANVLWTALTVGCTPPGDTVQRACLRLVKVGTAAPAPVLSAQYTLKAKGADWFAPGVGVDRSGMPHVGFSRSNANSSPGAVSAAVVSRTTGGRWSKPLTLTKGSAPFSDAQAPTTAAWSTRGSAAVDPTSPWDVWVAPPLSTVKLTDPTPNWTTRPARVSFASNAASTRVSGARVRPGARVTVTARLLRPDSSDGVKGLPIVLQKRVAGGSRWVTVGSARTAANGRHAWTVRVSRATDFRTVGPAVAQRNGQGRWVAGVTGRPVRVSIRR